MTDLDEVKLELPFEVVMASFESRQEFYSIAQKLLADNKQVRKDHKNLWLRCLAAEGDRDELKSLEPVHGDILPAIGSTVFIHLGGSNSWFQHTVVGYYVWPGPDGDKSLNRVFIRVRDSEGFLNSRLLKDVRTMAQMAKEG